MQKSKLVNEDLSTSDYDAEIRFMVVLDDFDSCLKL